MGEKEMPEPIAVGIAATLLGSISFQMALFYLTNHSDKDMRRYSYGVINQTVSIFCAVLLFQTFDDIVELYIEGLTLEMQAVVDMLHMLLWFTILQLALAYICGVGYWEAAEEETTDANKEPLLARHKSKEELHESQRRDLKCYSVLLAHLTGFASINAWGSLQQLQLFKSPAGSFAVVPMSACGLFFLQRITDHIRESLALQGDGKKDKKETTWDEECEEAENDVMGLTLSFSLTQAIRFTISGELPDQHGKEPEEVLHDHTTKQVLQLVAAGLACVPLMVIIFLRKGNAKDGEGDDDEEAADSESDEEDDGEPEVGKEECQEKYRIDDPVQAKKEHRWYFATVRKELGEGKYLLEWAWEVSKDDQERHYSSMRPEVTLQPGDFVEALRAREWCPAQIDQVKDRKVRLIWLDGRQKDRTRNLEELRVEAAEEEEEEESSLAERAMDALTITFAMAFAWCSFFSAEWGLAAIPALTDPMVLAVALTLFISLISFSAIRLLDIVDDFAKDTTNLFVAKSTTGDSFLHADMDKMKASESRQPVTFKAKKSVFVVEEKPERVGGRARNALLLKHGSHYLMQDGTLSPHKKDRSRALFQKVEKPYANRVRIQLNGAEYDLIPKGNGSTRKVDLVLKKIIRALGILVGFGWEQCFDEAVESLSQVMPSPHFAKFLLACFCIVIIVPAWKWYVLPMSEQSGWKFGFVVDHQDEKWSDIVTHLSKNKGLKDQAQRISVPLVQSYQPPGSSFAPQTSGGSESMPASARSVSFDVYERERGASEDAGAASPTRQPMPELRSSNSGLPGRSSSSLLEESDKVTPLRMPLQRGRSMETSASSPRGRGMQRHQTAPLPANGTLNLPSVGSSPQNAGLPSPNSPLSTSAGSDSAEVAALRRTNADLCTAAEGFLVLYKKLRETSNEDRRCLLRAYNQQMDAMLSRMRELQSQVARDASPSPVPSASSAGPGFPPVDRRL